MFLRFSVKSQPWQLSCRLATQWELTSWKMCCVKLWRLYWRIFLTLLQVRFSLWLWLVWQLNTSTNLQCILVVAKSNIFSCFSRKAKKRWMHPFQELTFNGFCRFFFLLFYLHISRLPCTDSLSQMVASVIRKQRNLCLFTTNPSYTDSHNQQWTQTMQHADY